MSEEKQRAYYTTSNGVKIALSGVSPLLISKLQTAGTLPDVPKRRVKLELEGMEDTYQEEELTADDLQTVEEEQAWKEYVGKRDAVLTKRHTGFIKAIFAKGVLVEMTNLDAWKEEQEYFDLPIPTHPTDLKIEYVQTELITNTEDMIGVITGVLAESGVPEEELESVRSMFRSSLRRGTPRKVETTGGEVGVVADLYGDESGALLEDMASEQIL